jgi:hypothetical protein
VAPNAGRDLGGPSSGTTIACRPFLWPRIGRRGDLAQVGKGQNITPLSPAADGARSAANVFAMFEGTTRVGVMRAEM